MHKCINADITIPVCTVNSSTLDISPIWTLQCICMNNLILLDLSFGFSRILVSSVQCRCIHRYASSDLEIDLYAINMNTCTVLLLKRAPK